MLLTYSTILEVVLVLLPVLLVVAFITVAERNTLASLQVRLGPNSVGYYGLLQAFADALKLLLKEYVAPTQANPILFFIAPIITLVFALLGWVVIPYGPGLALSYFNLGILYMLAVSSLATYGILLAGWSANSKYAFLGSLRSTAQLISYELVLSSALLIVVMLTGSLNFSVVSEFQRAVWLIFPLFPIFIIFLIGSIAETNRAPFDLAEAESELVSGFMTEHSSVIFVFFFLAEYASLVFMRVITSILYLGSYLLIDSSHLFWVVDRLMCNCLLFDHVDWVLYNRIPTREYYKTDPELQGLLYSINLGLKSFVLMFIFMEGRASLPRIRFDQLMAFCWTVLLPVTFAFIILIPCILYSYNIFPVNIELL